MTVKNLFPGLIHLAFILCLAPAAIFSYKHPSNNWDMLGYMAVVVNMEHGHSIEEVHKITYEDAKQNIPVKDFKQLTESSPFRQRFASDALQFRNLLAIYSVKPMYTWACYFFYKMGFNLPKATVIPSILSYLIIGSILFHWLKKYLQPFVAFSAGILVMYSGFSVELSRLSTPDCLSALFLFLVAYYVLEKPNPILLSLFSLLSIFARVDNIIACFFIASFLSFFDKWKLFKMKQYLLLLLLFSAVYIFAIFPVRQFGWDISFYFQYARHIDFSRDFSQPFTLSAYSSMIVSKLVTAIVSSHFIFFIFLIVIIVGLPKFSTRRLSFDQSFSLLLLAIALFRFCLLPDLSDRFYYGFYLVIIILLVRKIFFAPLQAISSHQVKE